LKRHAAIIADRKDRPVSARTERAPARGDAAPEEGHSVARAFVNDARRNAMRALEVEVDLRRGDRRFKVLLVCAEMLSRL